MVPMKPNQPLERTPPCCALRRRSRARWADASRPCGAEASPLASSKKVEWAFFLSGFFTGQWLSHGAHRLLIQTPLVLLWLYNPSQTSPPAPCKPNSVPWGAANNAVPG